MAANAAEFLIEIEQRIKGADAVSALDAAEQAVQGAVAAYKKLEQATQKAEQAVEKNSASMATARSAMEAAMKAGNPAAFWKQAAALDALQQKEEALAKAVKHAQAAQAAQAKVVSGAAGHLQATKVATEKTGLAAGLAKSEIFDLEGAFGDLGGPIGGAGKKIFEIGDALKKFASSGGPMGLVIAGAVLVSAAVFAVAAAFVAGVAAALKYGIALANVARNQRLTMEAMLESKGAASKMSGTFRDIQRNVGGSTEHLTDLVKQLKKADITGDNMSIALKAIATQEAAIGTDETSDLIEKLKTGQTSAVKLANTIEKKYGETARAKMIGLDQSVDRLKQNFGALFSGLKIEPLLKSIARIVDLFDETSTSGKLIKSLFEGFFQPLVNAADTALPYVMLFVVEFGITLLDLAIAFAPAIKMAEKLFGMEPDDTMEVVMQAATIAAIAFAAGVFMVILGFGLLAAIVAPVLLAIYNTFKLLVGIASFVKAAFEIAVKAIQGVDLKTVGEDVMKGLAKGIATGAPGVIAAMTSIADALPASVKKILDIGSPSKVFAEIGGYTAEGFTVGIEGEQDNVNRALSGMMSGQGRPTGGPGGNTYNYDVAINVNGAGESPRSIAMEVRQEMDRYFRDTAFELGASPA